MRIGYLMNSYPMTSTTFIKREIHALERLGAEVKRYSVRRWDTELVDPGDRDEQAATEYLLSFSPLTNLRLLLGEAVSNPRGLLRGLAGAALLARNARGRLVAHAAYLLEAIHLRRCARRDGIAHIHVHFSTNSAAVAMLTRRLGGPGYSFTAHGPDEFVDWPRASLAEKIAEARFVVAISHYCAGQLILAGGEAARAKTHVVRCGIDLESFRPTGAPFDAAAPFVCVGRLCRQKAQTLIVEAVGRIAPRHPELRMVFLGGGEAQAEVEAAVARLGLSDRVELRGWTGNDEVRDLLGRARALVLPSLAEGLPIVIMEALALGRPALTTWVAGIPELVDEGCGWLIPRGSVDHIAQALEAALEADPETLAQKGAEGRRRVAEAHDQTRNAHALHALIAAEIGAG